jgi:hypothetical protein
LPFFDFKAIITSMASDRKAPDAPTYESDLRLEYTARIIADRVAANKKLPLEVMLNVMDEYTTQNNHAAAAAIAERAAPFVHPRLKDLIVSGGAAGSNPIRIETTKGMAKLSAKELDLLEALLLKTGVAQ